MSDKVHVFIERKRNGQRHIVAFSVVDKELTRKYAEYNAVEKTPDLEDVELNLSEVNLKCNYILSNLTLEMVDELAKVPAS